MLTSVVVPGSHFLLTAVLSLLTNLLREKVHAYPCGECWYFFLLLAIFSWRRRSASQLIFFRKRFTLTSVVVPGVSIFSWRRCSPSSLISSGKRFTLPLWWCQVLLPTPCHFLLTATLCLLTNLLLEKVHAYLCGGARFPFSPDGGALPPH